MDNELGPVDCMIVAFPGNEFKGEVAPALAKLVESETVRIIDLVFVIKDENGEVAGIEMGQLDPKVQEALESSGIEANALFSDEDLQTAGEALETNSSALLMVWENLWAREVAQAMRDANGQLLEFNRIPHEVVMAAREWALENAGAEN